MTVVVLGNRLNRPVVSTELAGRLDVALAVRREDEPLVLSGGDAGDAGVPEADVMFEYVLDAGVDPAFVHRERRSLDTVGNAYFCRLLCDERGLSDLSLVTSDYHVPRARYIFERVFGPDTIRVEDNHVANLALEERRGAAIHESSSLALNVDLFAPVDDADVRAIGERIETAHGLYDDVPKPGERDAVLDTDATDAKVDPRLRDPGVDESKREVTAARDVGVSVRDVDAAERPTRSGR